MEEGTTGTKYAHPLRSLPSSTLASPSSPTLQRLLAHLHCNLNVTTGDGVRGTPLRRVRGFHPAPIHWPPRRAIAQGEDQGPDGVRACVFECVCVRARSALTCLACPVCVCACMHACMRACGHAGMRACVRACVWVLVMCSTLWVLHCSVGAARFCGCWTALRCTANACTAVRVFDTFYCVCCCPDKTPAARRRSTDTTGQLIGSRYQQPVHLGIYLIGINHQCT